MNGTGKLLILKPINTLTLHRLEPKNESDDTEEHNFESQEIYEQRPKNCCICKQVCCESVCRCFSKGSGCPLWILILMAVLATILFLALLASIIVLAVYTFNTPSKTETVSTYSTYNNYTIKEYYKRGRIICTPTTTSTLPADIISETSTDEPANFEAAGEIDVATVICNETEKVLIERLVFHDTHKSSIKNGWNVKNDILKNIIFTSSSAFIIVSLYSG